MKRLLIYLIFFLIFGSPINADDHRAYMGIEFTQVTEAIAKSKNLKKVEGVLIIDVLENSPASKAGLQNGDIILYINNKKVSANDLRFFVKHAMPGSNNNIKIFRKNRIFSKKLTLGVHPYKTGYFERKPSNKDIYPNAIEKAYYEKDCKMYGENIVNYSKTNKNVFKGFNPKCDENINIVIHEGIIEVYENSKLERATVFKESLPQDEVNKIDIAIEAYANNSNWYVKRNAKGEMLGKILKGDEIKSFNGEILEGEESLFDFLNQQKAGDYIEINLYRPKSGKSFTEKIQINKTINSQYIGLTKSPNSNQVYPFIIDKMADQTTGHNRIISEGLLLLTSINYYEKLLKDFNDLYQYYDAVSKTKDSNLPKKPIKKSYFTYLEDIKKIGFAVEKKSILKTNENYYALVIGNNNYEHLEKLDAAVNDAKVIAEILDEKYDFEVELLLNANYETTVDKFYTLSRKLTKDDNFLVFYAGHGYLDKKQNRGYWLPVDAKSDLPSKWISNALIADELKATEAKHVLLIVDSCFSGSLMRSSEKINDNKNLNKKYIDLLKSKKTRLVISSGGNEPVVDSDGGDHSIFAVKLIDTLKNNDSVLTTQDIFENIRKYVASNAEQTPERAAIYKAGHDGGDFLFFSK